MTTPVWFLTLPGVMTLDITGPAETLKLAGKAFTQRYIGPNVSVMTSTDMMIAGILQADYLTVKGYTDAHFLKPSRVRIQHAKV